MVAIKVDVDIDDIIYSMTSYEKKDMVIDLYRDLDNTDKDDLYESLDFERRKSTREEMRDIIQHMDHFERLKWFIVLYDMSYDKNEMLSGIGINAE